MVDVSNSHFLANTFQNVKVTGRFLKNPTHRLAVCGLSLLKKFLFNLLSKENAKAFNDKQIAKDWLTLEK